MPAVVNKTDGSVGSNDIADALAAQGIELDKAAIRLPLGPIKQVGESKIEIALHSDVTATIAIVIVAE